MGPPLIWNEVEKTKDGKSIKIRIQQVTEEMIEPVVEFMCQFFLPREPCCAFTGMADDPVSTEDMREMWRQCLTQGVGLVAILIDDDAEEGSTPTIVGANITAVSNKGDTIEYGKGDIFNSVLDIMNSITKEGNLYEKYSVEKYLTALGLTVHSDYHGLGIGLDIVKAREALCKTLGITMTATVFTASSSQHVAAKGGFEVVVDRNYSDLEINGENPVALMPGSIKLMAKTYS